MRRICFFSFVICFFFLFSNNKITSCDPLVPNTIDIVNRTCKRCVEEHSTHFSYNFCKTSLQVIPSSHTSNIHGLAVIVMELAIKNATSSVSSINNLLNSGAFNPFVVARLQDCLELYSNVIVGLIDGVAALLSEHYSNAYVELKAVMEASRTCEEGFKRKKGEVSPLTKLNDNLFYLCDIALCITDLV